MSLNLLRTKIDQYNNKKNAEVNRLVEQCLIDIPIVTNDNKEDWMNNIMSMIKDGFSSIFQVNDDDALLPARKCVYPQNSPVAFRLATLKHAVPKPKQVNRRGLKRTRACNLSPTVHTLTPKQLKTLSHHVPSITGRRNNDDGTPFYKCKWIFDEYWVSVYDLTKKYGKRIVGPVYEYDTDNGPEEGFSIKNVLKKRRNECLIRWVNYPAEFDSWEPLIILKGL
jgi:hypothetical protein